MTGVLLVVLWEFQVTRVFAWPVAKSLLAISPISAAGTCMAAYVGFYAVIAAFLVAVVKVLHGRGLLTFWAVTFVVVACGMPSLILLVTPTAYDGVTFRLSQLSVVLVSSAFAVLIADRLRRIAVAGASQ